MSKMVFYIVVGVVYTTCNETVFTILHLMLRLLNLQIFGVEDTTPVLFVLTFELRTYLDLKPSKPTKK